MTSRSAMHDHGMETNQNVLPGLGSAKLTRFLALEDPTVWISFHLYASRCFRLLKYETNLEIEWTKWTYFEKSRLRSLSDSSEPLYGCCWSKDCPWLPGALGHLGRLRHGLHLGLLWPAMENVKRLQPSWQFDAVCTSWHMASLQTRWPKALAALPVSIGTSIAARKSWH